eukprot:3101812-Pleurochrysis_carterae.AAC.1
MIKLVDRRQFFVRKRVESHDIPVSFFCSDDNLANFFTKPLAPRLFFALCDTITNVTEYCSLPGCSQGRFESRLLALFSLCLA